MDINWTWESDATGRTFNWKRNGKPVSEAEFNDRGAADKLSLGLDAAGVRAAIEAPLRAEIERLRVENAVLTAQLETLLAPPAPEGWIVTEGPKELLP